MPDALRSRLASGQVVVTAEIGAPRGADPAAISAKAGPLRGWVDAVNVTDNQRASVRMCSLAGSVLVLAAGVEPVMQLTCRDRNRIALQSDLLGAAALGIRNVLLMTGDHPRSGDHPQARPVFDLDSVQLAGAARDMRDHARLLSGGRLAAAPDWLIGAVENPAAPAARLARKVAAGVEFVQTQYVFDVPQFARWLREVRDLGLDQRCAILAGVGPVRSIRALEHLAASLPGVQIPAALARRLRGVPAGQVAAEGLRICADTIQQLLQLPGVRGIHLMAPGFEHGVPEILDQAGLAHAH
ncbi:MAG TPA: methylenetetrahydrofolate reductase [Streptosporangiaceae bacterium]